MSFFEIWLGIMKGVDVTLLVTLLGLAYAVPFALVFGVAQFLASGMPRVLTTVIIEFWRSSAVIILLFVFFYALPTVGIELTAITVSSMVLGLNAGAYASQAVRGGLEALDRGQREAGSAVGMSRAQTLVLIELPQVLAMMAPTFVNQVIQLIKGTALVSLVTLSDMTFKAKEIGQVEYNPIGVYGALLLAYFVVCYPIALLGRRMERRLNPMKGSTRGL